MTFNAAHMDELNVVARWLTEEHGVCAPEAALISGLKKMVKRTYEHCDERREHIHDFAAYFASRLSDGGSVTPARQNATKAEKDAAEVRRRRHDEKRWQPILMELADRGDGQVINACRALEEAGKQVTVSSVRAITKSLLPEEDAVLAGRDRHEHRQESQLAQAAGRTSGDSSRPANTEPLRGFKHLGEAIQEAA